MITTPEQLAALRALPHDHLVGLVVEARLHQTNAELLLREALARETSLRAILNQTDIIQPGDLAAMAGQGRAA